MGYGPLAYVRAFITLATPLGKKTMAKKADDIRKALIEGASPHRIAHVAVIRAQREHGEKWLHAAIAQLAQILGITRVNARVLISEHCTAKTN